MVLCIIAKRWTAGKAPIFPYFCVFGTVGGYVLLDALACPGVMVVACAFVPLSTLSLIGSLIYLARSRPFTGFHWGAAISCGLALTGVTALFAFAFISNQ
jgi:hypothetical protein